MFLFHGSKEPEIHEEGIKEEVRTNRGRERKEKEKEIRSTASSKTSKEWTFVEIESNST